MLEVQAEQLRQSILKYSASNSLVLGDIADIQYAPEPAIGAAQIMGKPRRIDAYA
jgi:multidrug efflux pump subunit AcrB